MGVIIAQSFLSVEKVFIPISNIFEFHEFVNAFGIALAYFIVISGWLGYHESIKRHPHLGNIGLVRYFLDVVILFFVYYLVTIANPKASDQYGMIFLWVIPAIFICYSCWDIVKFYEYKHTKLLENTRAVRMKITWEYGLLSLFLAFLYYSLTMYYGVEHLQFWQNKTSLDFAFMWAYLFLFLAYRLRKKTGVSIKSFKL